MTEPFTFLLVEDNEDHAELIAQSFERCEPVATLAHVTSGEAAIARLRDPSVAAPDVILLDLNLPGVSGLDVLQEVKADDALRRIPVVVLTTSGAERDRRAAYLRHANSYVTKPADFHRMQELMCELSRYWSTTNQPPA